jgi:peptidyl-prolyl cis-trans isomerase D
MLQTIRDKVQGWIATTIVLLLIIPFAFWGINYYFRGGAEISVVSVGDRDVPLRDYQRTLQNLRQRWVAMTQGKVPVDDEILKKQTLDSLINRELMAQAAADLHLRVSNEQVRTAIEGVDAFRGANGFDRLVYESTISQMGLSPAGFEAQVRGDLTAEQLQSAVVGSVFSASDEVRTLAALRKQTRDIQYAILSSDTAKEGTQIAEADIKALYDKNPDLFKEPERVKLAWLHITLQQLADHVPVDDATLQSWYQDNAANYTVAEQREVRQLLVPVPENADPAVAQATQARAEAIMSRIRAGATLKDVLAEEDKSGREPLEYSDFGFLGRGVLDAEIENAVFAAPAGQSVGPIASKFGFHVMEIGQIKQSKANSFADVRADVERDYRHAEAAKGYAELSDRLATLAYEHPDTLETAAEELHLHIEESELFSRDAPPGELLANPQMLEAAFSEEVLANHNNSDLIELEGDQAMVLRVTEHVPASVMPLDQVHDRIATRLRFERAREATETRGASLLAQLQAGAADASALAGKEDFQWQISNDVLREDPGINRAVLRAAFSAGRPKPSAPVYAGVSMGTGDYALVMVTDVAEPAPESFTKADLDAVREELDRLKATRGWSHYIKELRRRADVKVHEELL